MTYIIYDDGNTFTILYAVGDGIYEYCVECETKASAQKLINALNAAEKK